LIWNWTGGNLKRRIIRGGLETGFESNNQMSVIGTELTILIPNSSGYGIIYRKCENYFCLEAMKTVQFSQFGKKQCFSNGGINRGTSGANKLVLFLDEARDGAVSLP